MHRRTPFPSDLRNYGLAILFLFAGCGQPPVQRVELGEAESAAEMVLTPSPDSKGAGWSVAPDGKAVQFGQEGEAPFLSLACTIAPDAGPRIAIIRHALSQPGAKALFAVMGNGTVSRLKLDAKLAGGGWRWEGSYPADAPELDVFTGRRAIEATLPGAGTLRIGGSGLPREFIDWCRRSGADAPLSSPAQG